MFTLTSIYAAAIFNGLLQFFLLLFNKRGNPIANRLLAVLILLLVLSMWNMYVDASDISSVWKTIDYGYWTSPFFWGPALYLYVGTLVGKFCVDLRMILLHASLGIAVFVVGSMMQLFFTNQTGVVKTLFDDVRLLITYLQMFLYVFASYRLLSDHGNEIRQNSSIELQPRLFWLRFLVAAFFALLVVDMCTIVPFSIRKEGIPFFSVIMLAETVTIFSIGYFSLYQSGIALGVHSQPKSIKQKYHGSPVDDQIGKNLMIELQRVMKEDKPYLRSDLSLSDLSESVGVSQHYISQIINQQSQKNFYEFINEYRIEHAATSLSQKDSLNITAIAHESGFNNRTSFNNAFKKFMGMTPTEYRNPTKRRNPDPS